MPNEQAVLIELQYFPPIQFFSKKFYYQDMYIEEWENYSKGSYRNRCHIAGVNGPLRLTIPLKKGKNQQQQIRDVQITYDFPWQSNHWTSIRSAYGNAPYFDYYEAKLHPFFKKKYQFLFDFNWDLLMTVNELLGLNDPLKTTSEYHPKAAENILDLRNAIHPKPRFAKDDPHFQTQKYAQVFQEKTGFLPNLSILDLLFCTGPQALLILEDSFVP